MRIRRAATRPRKLADLYGWDDYGWDDREEVEYRKAKTEAALAALPTDSDRLVLFDSHRARIASLGDEQTGRRPRVVRDRIPRAPWTLQLAGYAVGSRRGTPVRTTSRVLRVTSVSP